MSKENRKNVRNEGEEEHDISKAFGIIEDLEKDLKQAYAPGKVYY